MTESTSKCDILAESTLVELIDNNKQVLTKIKESTIRTFLD